MNLLITLCARGGSVGIPGKNIKLLNGKPLIGYSIDTARQFADLHNADVTLSTDSDEIRDVARKLGVATDYVRPAELATNAAGKIPVLNHVLLYEEARTGKRYDLLLDLDITSPLRSVDDLSNALDILSKDNEAYNIFSVSKANRSPYFNMVEKKVDGYYRVVKETTGSVLTRQNAPIVYDMNASFYFYRRIFFDLKLTSAITERSLIYEVPHLCFDLDHQIDFEFMSFLMREDKLDFKL